MFRKVILLSILSLGITTNNLQAGPNKLIKAAKTIDAAFLGAGLLAVSGLNFLMLLEDFNGDLRLPYLRSSRFFEVLYRNPMIGIRCFIEAGLIMQSFSKNDNKDMDDDQKKEFKRFIQIADGIISPIIFVKLSAALFGAASQENNQIYSGLLMLFAARCLLHLKTITKPVIECLK